MRVLAKVAYPHSVAIVVVFQLRQLLQLATQLVPQPDNGSGDHAQSGSQAARSLAADEPPDASEALCLLRQCRRLIVQVGLRHGRCRWLARS